MDFTSRLLSNSQIKLYRKDLKMPLLILDEKDRRYSRFITNNNLIEDPPSFEKERSMINPWTQEEKGVFMEMLATFGKDFARISSFLSHKTTADCIEFYYKNHKSESFRDVKKQLDLRKQLRCLSANTSYLVTSGKKWNHEANAASPDMLGAVPVAVANNNGTSRNQQKYAGRFVGPSYHNLKVLNESYSSVERACSIEIPGNEKEPTGIDTLADTHGALSSEAVSSCFTSSVSPPEKMIFVRMARPLTPEITHIEEDTCSDEGCGELVSVDWTDEEKSMFIRSLTLYGKDFARISECVGTKSRDQCKIFFSKGRKCLSLDQIHPGAGNGSTRISDAIRGSSETDDACAAEMDSAICSTQSSCSRMDVDFTQSVANTGVEGSVHVGNISLQNEINRSSEQYDVGRSHQEEVDVKVDGLEFVLRVEKLETERESVQPRVVEGMGDVALKHSGLVPRHDCVESTMDKELGEVAVGGELGKVDNGISVSLTEPSTASCIEGEPLKPEITADVQQGGIPEGKSPAVGVKSEVEFEQVPMVSETGSGERKRKIDTDKINGVSFSLAAESSDKESDSDKAPRMNACPKRVFSFSTHQEPMPVELLSCSQMKPQMSPKQDRAYSLPLSTVLADPSSICSDGSFCLPSQSTINFNEYLHKLHQGSGTKDFYQQCLSRINLNQMDQSLHVLSGYPVQVMNHQETKRKTHIINEKPALCESHSMGNLGIQLNQYFVPDVHNEKGDVSVASNSRSGMLFFPRKEDTSDSRSRPCSVNSRQETEQSTRRTGDVKLFGQILTNPSSQQKSNPSLQETDSKPLSPKQKKPAIAKMSTSRTDSCSSISPPRSECIGKSNLGEVPLRSYGYWDGHRIQTGFSSLPESAVMLAAYQGPLAGTPFLSAKDSGVSSNGAAVNYQQACVQAPSANGNRLDSFPELQKRNEFELVSGFQQGGRTAMARLGVNRAGGSRGILVGGSGVSDPVAALKMVKLYTREMETWTRDLNGR